MKEPLTNIEAEAEMLGCLLRDCGELDRVAEVISGDDFASDVHGRIFDALLREVSLGKYVSPVTLKPYFEDDAGLKEVGGLGYLAKLTSVVSFSPPSDTAKHLAELALRRRMKVGLMVAADACADLDVTTGEIINHADTAVAVNSRDAIHQPTAGECFDELFASYAARDLGVSCGCIPELDELIGPMRPKQLIIGAGRPGMGKTALALSYCIGAARKGHGVLFVSLEMSSAELAARMAADLCFDSGEPVPYSAIRDGDFRGNQANRVRDAGGFANMLPFQVVDAGSLTIGRLNMLIRRHARRFEARGAKLELVVVDYLQLLHPDTKGRSTYEAVSEVSRGLKAMAKDHGIAVLALAQLSRSVENRPDKRPQLSDLRDSGQIEQDADAVLFLLRQEYYLKQDEPEQNAPTYMEWRAKMEKAQGLIEFIVAKRRNGVTGSDFGRFHGAYQAVRGFN